MEEKIEQIKTTNGEPNSININNKYLYNNNSINNANNKGPKSRYINNSSSKKKNNQTYTIDTCYTKSMIDSNEEKNYRFLAKQVRIQNKIIEEYQKWINILIPAINDKKIDNEYKDIGTPIQEGLQSIEELKSTNFKVKSLIIKEKLKNENLEKQIEKKKKTQNMLIKEYNEKDHNQANNLKKEKEQLLMNLQMLANEVDVLNENNKALYDKIQKDSKLQKLYELVKEKSDLKEENKLYKKMVVLKNRKNYIDLKGSLLFVSLNSFQNPRIIRRNNDINDITEDYSSIGPMSGMGEYKLEKDENVNRNFFFCGL